MKTYYWQIIKWTSIGLLLRLIIMPFTMHGQDLCFINYFPMMFVKEGIWDPYGFISSSFQHFPFTYYGPVSFIVMSAANFIFIKLFNPVSLITMLELSSTMIGKHFSTIDYVHAFSKLNLFRNLFLMKSPYLVFDFVIAAILLKLATSKEAALAGYKLWMLNIVVLHSAYMIGQFDLIVAFFIISALLAAVKKRPYISIISLSLGGAAKIFPYILILPTCLLLGDNWKKRISLLFTALVTTIFLYLPFYLSSGSAIFGIFIQGRYYSGVTRWLLIGIFAVLYAFISWYAIKDSKKSEAEEKLIFYFLSIGFLAYAVNPISFRYFVFITPLLALILPHHKKFGIFAIVIILILAFARLPARELQLGLFAPLNPDYFMSLPSIQEVVGRFVNIEIVYKVMARILLLCFFIATGWIWYIKVRNEKGPAWITI